MVELDPSQRRAARANHPVQLVLAGPGAGKTSTLVGRFRHLRDSGIDPRRILALTFTKKAAEEMRGRIARDLALESGGDLRVYTFHSLALRCLQRNPHLAGLPERIDVWSTPQQRAVFSGRRMFWNDEGDILDIIAGAKEQLLDARRYAKGRARDDEVGHRAAEFFTVYEEALQAAGAIDFADMVPLLLKAMAANPAYGRSVAGAIDHLLVDEYQDINLGQHRLIEHFRCAGVHLWAVGDDDQTLFTFRAADIRFTLDFKRRHRDAVLHLLDRNYRSTPDIVAAAKRLIARNRDRFKKDYGAVPDGPGTVAIRGYATPDIEVRQVTLAIAALIRDGVPPREIAVLYRAGSTGLAFQGALEAMHIPFDVRGAGDLWQSPAARLFLGALFYLLDDDDRRAIEKMGTGKRGEAVRRRLDKVPATGRSSFAQACRHARNAVSDALPKRSAEREQRDWTNLCDALAGLAGDCKDLDELMDRIAAQSRALRTPSEDAVVLSTVHSAKGLEWDAVFVVGLEEGVMPSAGAEIEEERRVAYVAVTRAKRILGLTYAAQRGGTTSKRSRFVAEFAGDALAGTDADHPEADSLLPLGPPYQEEPQPAPPSRAPAAAAPIGPAAGKAKALGADTDSRSKQKWAVEPADMAPYAPDPDAAAAQWTARDDAKLQASFAVASGLDEICAATGKAPDAVMSRLVRLRLLPSKAAARAIWG